MGNACEICTSQHFHYGAGLITIYKGNVKNTVQSQLYFCFQGNAFLGKVKYALSKMKPIHAHLMLQIFLYSWNLRKLLLVVQKRLPEDMRQTWQCLPIVTQTDTSDNYNDLDMDTSDEMAVRDEDESSSGEESSAE